MPQVSLREKDSLEFALKKLKRLCEKANIWAAVRNKQHYDKPTWVRKRNKLAAVKRQKKRDAMERISTTRKSRPAYYLKLEDTTNE